MNRRQIRFRIYPVFDLYLNFYNIIVITKFDPVKTGVDLRRKYSADGGKTFKAMTYEKIDTTYDANERGDFKYEVVRWKIVADSLKNIQVYIRIEEYGNGPIFDMIGPITIN